MRAQFALGDLFFNGRGVPQDYGEAINWYGKAANQGHPVAQYLMGVLYREGWGADHDPMEAYKWFFLASRHREEVRKASKKYNPERARANLAASSTDRKSRKPRNRPAGSGAPLVHGLKRPKLKNHKLFFWHVFLAIY